MLGKKLFNKIINKHDSPGNDFVIDLKKPQKENVKPAKRIKIGSIFIISTIALVSSLYFVQAKTESEASIPQTNKIEITTSTSSIPTSVKMSATVQGWYEIYKTSNERLDITTNMQIYVNGKKFTKTNSQIKEEVEIKY